LSFFAELKRRNVFRVGIAYAVTSWLLIQVTDILFESIGTPPWVMQAMFVVLAAGFVIALIFAWAFELTPEGVKKEKDVDHEASIAPRTAQKLNMVIGVLLVIALAYIAYDKLFLETDDASDVTEISSLESEPPASEATSELTEPEQKPADTQKSIVVLPFVNMSNDPEQEFFSDGLSEELLNVLAQIKDLRVISRTSAFAFKGKDVDIPTIAAQLNVTHVLEGSVRKAGEDIRITAQLIEVKTDSHLWSDAYNRKLENVFEIQEEISKAIAAELQVTLGTSGKTGRPTESLEAWQLFLRGRHLYQNRGKAQLERTIELLKQAVDLDPDFDEAWANLAAANVVNGYSEEEGYSDFYREGKLAASRAIEIDPDNGFAHAVLGLVHMSELNWDEAMRELDLAIQLNPNETNSLLWKGISLIALGYVDQASAMFKQAERLDPAFTNVHNWLASTYRVKGDVENMRRHIRKLQRLDPDFPLDSFINFAPYSGDLDTAEELMRAEEVRNLGSDVLAVAAFSALRDSGRKEEAVKTLLANESLASASDLAPYLWKIGAIGETIANFQQLFERGRGLRATNSLQIFWDDFNRDQLSDPAVTEFFESIGMVAYWRKHGDPDYCRVDGAHVECGDL
jgi:TolB-like protein/Flp pilus assembly protein TadD